jgi:hypothetical protein
MPTPFTHLLIARQMLDSPDLPAALRQEAPAFCLGNVAPDVQNITGEDRASTHFFTVPLGGQEAVAAMLSDYPTLARRAQLAAPRAAFIAGYLAHLELDEFWIAEVFEPYFGGALAWGTFRERLYLHNALRALWDQEDLARLPASTADCLRAAAPDRWLPFGSDAALREWRDFLAAQIEQRQTSVVEVFAQRMRANADEFAALVSSPEEMRERVLRRVPPEVLERFRERGLARCAGRVADYWK